MAGFSRPTTTPTPDELFDHWLTRLSGPQIRVLLYIIRRTLGFKKKADAISLDQFHHGIASEGDIIDEGCGVRNRRALTGALEGLATLGLIEDLKRSTPQHGNLTTIYRLVFERDTPRSQGRGFKKPTTTPVPDDLFDFWLTRLTDSELCVLLYIVRRTMGFRKNQETISLQQFLHGLTTDSGRVLDEGCGIRNRTTLIRAIDGLVAKELIDSIHQSSPERGYMPTLYRLVFDGDEPSVVVADPRSLPADTVPQRVTSTRTVPDAWPQQAAFVPHGGTATGQGGIRQTDQGDTSNGPGGYVKRTRGIRQTDQGGAQAGLDKNGPLPDEHRLEMPTKGYANRTRGVRKSDRAGTAAAPAHRPIYVSGQVRRPYPQQTDIEQTDNQQTDSIEISIEPTQTDRARHSLSIQDGRPQLRVDATYQALVRPISDIGRELGDEAATRASVSRAYNLMMDTGISLDDFLQVISEAKVLTRAYQPGITKTRGDAGALPRKNLMPYFFATLDSLLHSKEHLPQRHEARAPQRKQVRSLRSTRDTADPMHAAPPERLTVHEEPKVALIDSVSLPMPETHPIWRAVLADLHQVLTEQNFNTWLAHTRVVNQQEHTLQIAVPDVLHRDWLDRKLRGRIEGALKRLGYGTISIEFVVSAS